MKPTDHDLLEELRKPLAEPSDHFGDDVIRQVRGLRRRKQRRDLLAQGVLTVCLLVTLGLLVRQRGWLYTPPGRVASAQAGVDWLLGRQRADGGWDAAGAGGHPAFSQGVSALATLALLHAPDPAPPEAVESAAGYLARSVASHQPGQRPGPEFYNHLLSLDALLELEARRPDPARRELLKKSLHALVRHQLPDGGWGYDGETPMAYAVSERAVSNSAVTWWMAHLLRKGGGLRLPGADEALRRAEHWLAARFKGPLDIRYRPGGDFEAGPENALYWMAVRNMSAPASPPDAGELKPDAYRDLFRIQVLRNRAPIETVVRNQSRNGAWEDPEDRWWSAGGTVYVTAASVLSLVPQGV